MRKPARVRGRLTIGACMFAVAVTSACATTAARRQTDIMEKSGAVNLSAAVLRARVDDLANRLAGRIVEMTDEIRAASEDPAVRRSTIAFKADSIPALYTAAFRVDPLTAAVDVWAFTFQVTHYLDDGAGRDRFGEQQTMARAGAASLLADADATLQTIAAKPEDYDEARAHIEGWALAHPIERSLSSRPTAATFMAELGSDDRGTFAAVGAVTDTVEDLSERLNIYATLLPKQARWEGELLLSQLSGEHNIERAFDVVDDVDGALVDFHAVADAARRADAFLADVPELMGGRGVSLAKMVAAERKAMLEGLELERLRILEFLAAERSTVLAALSEERATAIEALHEERVASFAEADAIRLRAWDDAESGMRDLVDYTLRRVVLLLLVLMLAAGGLGVAGYWLTGGLRRRAAAL